MKLYLTHVNGLVTKGDLAYKVLVGNGFGLKGFSLGDTIKKWTMIGCCQGGRKYKILRKSIFREDIFYR